MSVPADLGSDSTIQYFGGHKDYINVRDVLAEGQVVPHLGAGCQVVPHPGS